MALAKSSERAALLAALNGQRKHIFEALQGLDEGDLRRQVLPSGWSCLGLVNHLSLDDERFWFRAVVAGEQRAIEDVLGSSANAWEVGADEPAEVVLESYRGNIALADGIIAAHALDESPVWWPDFFGSWRLENIRKIILHVITETATHAGHLDAARELIDGKQHLVLTD